MFLMGKLFSLYWFICFTDDWKRTYLNNQAEIVTLISIYMLNTEEVCCINTRDVRFWSSPYWIFFIFFYHWNSVYLVIVLNHNVNQSTFNTVYAKYTINSWALLNTLVHKLCLLGLIVCVQQMSLPSNTAFHNCYPFMHKVGMFGLSITQVCYTCNLGHWEQFIVRIQQALNIQHVFISTVNRLLLGTNIPWNIAKSK